MNKAHKGQQGIICTHLGWLNPRIDCKGADIFKAGYRGGRIFGGVPNYFAWSNWGIKNFGKNQKIYDGLRNFNNICLTEMKMQISYKNSICY